jgi:hypothetical protein
MRWGLAAALAALLGVALLIGRHVSQPRHGWKRFDAGGFTLDYPAPLTANPYVTDERVPAARPYDGVLFELGEMDPGPNGWPAPPPRGSLVVEVGRHENEVHLDAFMFSFAGLPTRSGTLRLDGGRRFDFKISAHTAAQRALAQQILHSLRATP